MKVLFDADVMVKYGFLYTPGWEKKNRYIPLHKWPYITLHSRGGGGYYFACKLWLRDGAAVFHRIRTALTPRETDDFCLSHTGFFSPPCYFRQIATCVYFLPFCRKKHWPNSWLCPFFNTTPYQWFQLPNVFLKPKLLVHDFYLLFKAIEGIILYL